MNWRIMYPPSWGWWKRYNAWEARLKRNSRWGWLAYLLGNAVLLLIALYITDYVLIAFEIY